MKKYINTSMVYAFLALLSGLFFREFTKLNHFTGTTTLSLMHTHLFALGMLFFLLLAVLENQLKISSHRWANHFFIMYNSGLVVTVGSFLWRGILQTQEITLLKGISAAISGISGLGHISITIAFILFFILLKQQHVRFSTEN